MGKLRLGCVGEKAFEPVPGGSRSGVPGDKRGTHSSHLSQLRAVTTGLEIENSC